MQSLTQLPAANVILDYLQKDRISDGIEPGALEKISKLLGNKLLNREEMRQSIEKNLHMSIVKIIFILDALERCAEGKPLVNSSLKINSIPQLKLSLPSSAVILEFLRQDCMTENIEIEILNNIACAVENRLFNYNEIKTLIKALGVSIDSIKIDDICYKLQCCAQGEKPIFSLMRSREIREITRTKEKMTVTIVEAVAIELSANSPEHTTSKVTQEQPALPSSAVILEYLGQHCMTENIKIEILNNIACAVENRLFNRNEIETLIKALGLPIDSLKIIDIGYTLQCCAQGKKPSISFAKRSPSLNLLQPSKEVTFSANKSPLLNQPLPSKEETLRFPEMLVSLGVRVGSFAQLCLKIRNQINENNQHAKYNNETSKLHLKYLSKKQYSYKNGMIQIDHDPKCKIATIKTVDIPKKVVKKLQDLMLECDLTIKSLINYFSTNEEHVMRIKKELYNLTHYDIIIDSSMSKSDEPECHSGYVIKWTALQNLSLDEVRDMTWGSRYHDIYWDTLDVEKMSECFIREFSNKINWFNLSRKQETLSKKFKLEFKDKLTRS